MIFGQDVGPEQCWKELSFLYPASHIVPAGDQSCKILSIFAISGEWLTRITMTSSSCALCVLITCISSEYQHHDFGNPIVLNKPWPLECWQQTAGRYTSTTHIGFLNYEFQDQCLPLWWVCPKQRNKIVDWSIARHTPHGHASVNNLVSVLGTYPSEKQDCWLKHSQTHSSWPFLIASHRFLIFDSLVSDFSDKRNFSNERVVVCQADSVELYHFCQGLHKASFWSVNSPC